MPGGPLYRDQGVVLRTIKLGEADRIVSFVTQGHGKVRAVAKGVRKTKSRFGGRLEPITHVSLLLYEGRELDIVTQAETLDHFRTIREDLDRVSRATSLLEAVDQVAQEREPNVRLYQMLVGALRALAANNAPVLVGAFFWKLLSLEGAHPLLDQCASCGRPDGLEAFDLLEGGALCRDCRRGLPVSPAGLDLLRRILGGGLADALGQPPGPATHEVEHLAAHSLEQHLERRLRSLHVLDRS
ncbi:MAG TPA: DNA repair protein RecO [Acidimicrobiales bacterium]|nr:DNA repair protein RecO [Acidimicrobiales bacterium]